MRFKVGDIVVPLRGIVPLSDLKRADVDSAVVEFIDDTNEWLKLRFKSNKVSFTDCWARHEWVVHEYLYNSPLYQALT